MQKHICADCGAGTDVCAASLFQVGFTGMLPHHTHISQHALSIKQDPTVNVAIFEDNGLL